MRLCARRHDAGLAAAEMALAVEAAALIEGKVNSIIQQLSDFSSKSSLCLCGDNAGYGAVASQERLAFICVYFINFGKL